MTRLVAFVVTTWLLSSVWAGSLWASDPPGKVLDLSRWKLTLPVNTDRAGEPDEIEQPALKGFQDSQWFFAEGSGVVFRANCGGRTTKGSDYPRCELRETRADGKQEAEWSTDDREMHTLTMTAAITKTPAVKRHVVCVQIHDARDDVLMVRLEGKKLFVERNGEGDVRLDSEYRLGTPFTLQIQAGEGQIRLWHDGVLKMEWKTSRKGCYFKAGCYTQSNPAKGDAAEQYGEVVISRLRLAHSRANATKP